MKVLTVSQHCLRLVERTKCVRSLNLAVLQQLSKMLLLLARGSYMLSIKFGDLPLHRVHSSRPRLLKEGLCWLEHSESGNSRWRHGNVLLLLLLLMLLMLLLLLLLMLLMLLLLMLLMLMLMLMRLPRGRWGRSRFLYSLWHLGVGLHYALLPRLLP
jgi:hypothetical protein